MVNNSTNINKTNNHLNPLNIKMVKKQHWKSRSSWLGMAQKYFGFFFVGGDSVFTVFYFFFFKVIPEIKYTL